MSAGQNSGHGHVWPRPDGMKARCGGPALCAACAYDLALQVQADEQGRAYVGRHGRAES